MAKFSWVAFAVIMACVVVIGGGGVFIWKTMGVEPAAQSIIGDTGAAAGTGGTLTLIDPSNTVTITYTMADKLNKVSGISYIAGTLYPVVSGVADASVSIAGTSSGGSDAYGLNKNVAYFLEPTGGYTEYGSFIADSTKPTQNEVLLYATPEMKAFDVSAAAYAGTWNDTSKILTIPSIGLVAGGASKTYKLFGQINTAYKQFGVTGILFGMDVVTDTKYTVGSTMTRLGTDAIPASFINSNVKKAYRMLKPSINSNDGLAELGQVTIQLNGGQTGAAITGYVADEAPFRATDGVSKLVGINKDDSSSTDIGATNAQVYWTV